MVKLSIISSSGLEGYYEGDRLFDIYSYHIFQNDLIGKYIFAFLKKEENSHHALG